MIPHAPTRLNSTGGPCSQRSEILEWQQNILYVQIAKREAESVRCERALWKLIGVFPQDTLERFLVSRQQGFERERTGYLPQ